MTETRNASPDTLGGGLKPCPFCGSANLAAVFHRFQGEVSCLDCGCELPLPEKSPETQAGVWNRRVETSADRPVGMSAANETLNPPINDSGEGELVAWRWWNKPDGVWNYQEGRQRIAGAEHQPLYAAPSPKGKTDGEAFTKLVDAFGRWVVEGAEANEVMEAVAALIAVHADDIIAEAALSYPAQALPDGEVGQ